MNWREIFRKEVKYQRMSSYHCRFYVDGLRCGMHITRENRYYLPWLEKKLSKVNKALEKIKGEK